MLTGPCLIATCAALSILLEINVRFSFTHQTTIMIILSILRTSLALLFIIKLVLVVSQSLSILEVPILENFLLLLLHMLTLFNAVGLFDGSN